MSSGAGNRVPDYQREIKELRAEIRNLWQALARGPAMPPVQKQMPFSWSGVMSGTRASGPWFAETNLTITGATIGLRGTSGTTTTVRLVVNDITVDTFTMPAGTSRGGAQRRHDINTGDKINLVVVAGGGSDLTVFLSYITNNGW